MKIDAAVLLNEHHNTSVCNNKLNGSTVLWKLSYIHTAWKMCFTLVARMKKTHARTWLIQRRYLWQQKCFPCWHSFQIAQTREHAHRSIPGMNPQKMQTEWTCTHSVYSRKRRIHWELLKHFHSISRVKAWAELLLPPVELNAAQKSVVTIETMMVGNDKTAIITHKLCVYMCIYTMVSCVLVAISMLSIHTDIP